MASHVGALGDLLEARAGPAPVARQLALVDGDRIYMALGTGDIIDNASSYDAAAKDAQYHPDEKRPPHDEGSGTVREW